MIKNQSISTANQIAVPIEMYSALKNWCNRNRVNMSRFYIEMVQSFFQRSLNKEMSFYASRRNGQRLTIWLPQSQALKIKKAAKKNHVSCARVLYTILQCYLSEKKIYIDELQTSHNFIK